MAKTVEWNYIGFDLVGLASAPYYYVAFKSPPSIEKAPLRLEEGGEMRPGAKVAYLGSRKSSAGFRNLHPVAPLLFRYVGIAHTPERELVLWQPEIDGEDYLIEQEGYSNVYCGHWLGKCNENGDYLIFSNAGGGGRIIETLHYFSDHSEVPAEYYPKGYSRVGLC